MVGELISIAPGITVRIEFDAGDIRFAGGSPLPCPYGSIVGISGADGEEVDAYVGPNPSPLCFVLSQLEPISGAFDELKIIFQVSDEPAARTLYLEATGGDPRRVGGVRSLPVEDLSSYLYPGRSELCAFSSSQVAEDEPPARLLLASYGETATKNGGPIVLDTRGAEMLLRRWEAEGSRELILDLNHLSLEPELAVNPAAAGAAYAFWVPEVDASGVWARFVRWLPTGEALVRSRSYAWWSPVWLLEKGSRRIVGVHSLALTNDPATIGIKSLLALSRRLAGGGSPMPDKVITITEAELATLPEGADACGKMPDGSGICCIVKAQLCLCKPDGTIVPYVPAPAAGGSMPGDMTAAQLRAELEAFKMEAAAGKDLRGEVARLKLALEKRETADREAQIEQDLSAASAALQVLPHELAKFRENLKSPDAATRTAWEGLLRLRREGPALAAAGNDGKQPNGSDAADMPTTLEGFRALSTDAARALAVRFPEKYKALLAADSRAVFAAK